jgi:hypothetical protein
VRVRTAHNPVELRSFTIKSRERLLLASLLERTADAGSQMGETLWYATYLKLQARSVIDLQTQRGPIHLYGAFGELQQERTRRAGLIGGFGPYSDRPVEYPD